MGVVALSELGIAPAGVLAPRLLRPLLSLLRVSHHAVNVRTYVRPAAGGPPGVYFFSLDCSHVLASFGARLLFNLPYRLARIHRSKEESGHRFGQHRLSSARHGPSAMLAPTLDVTWGAAAAEPPPRAAEAGSLAAFLCERYYLYATAGLLMRRLLGVASLWRGTLAHAPWPLQAADASVQHSTMLQAIRQSITSKESTLGGADMCDRRASVIGARFRARTPAVVSSSQPMMPVYSPT